MGVVIPNKYDALQSPVVGNLNLGQRPFLLMVGVALGVCFSVELLSPTHKRTRRIGKGLI